MTQSFDRRHKVSVVGSGNWGSAIAKMVAENCATHPDIFEPVVEMWVYEEQVKDPSSGATRPLTEIINERHENVKYLPGIRFPETLHANPDIAAAVKDASILVFNLPHQFMGGICDKLKGHILPFARGISCIKGVDVSDGAVSLFSETIGRKLGIYCGALSGANIATEVAKELYSETTIAYDPPPMDAKASSPGLPRVESNTSIHDALNKPFEHKDSSGTYNNVKLIPMPLEYPPVDHSLVKSLFHRPYFHVRVIHDVAGVSLGGALKNIVALAAGFVDGKGWGDNAKAAVMRVGLLEMVKFGRHFFQSTVIPSTFTEESCGVADLITSCAGGRNHRCAMISVQKNMSIEDVRKEVLNGQMLQGVSTAEEVFTILRNHKLENEFPLFTIVHKILVGEAVVDDIPTYIER